MGPLIDIAFVGLGFGGYIAETLLAGTLLAGTANEFFRVTGVCDSDASKAAGFASKHRVKAYPTLDHLLEDDRISSVALFTGPAGRAELLRRIIRAGKDVITTKPFELDPIAARSVLEEAQALGSVIHVNSPEPERPDYLHQIEEWRKEFDLGSPISCRGEMLASYRETADGRWLDDPDLCPAAPVFRLGIYSISDIIRIFGRVSEVQVLSTRIFTGRPTADNAQLSLRFENGALGSVHASFCVDDGQHYANSLTLHFEHGTIWRNVFPVGYGKAEGSSRLMLAATCGKREVLTRECTLPAISGSYQWQALYDAITGTRAIEMPIDEIVHGMEIVAAMSRAERSGQTEAV